MTSFRAIFFVIALLLGLGARAAEEQVLNVYNWGNDIGPATLADFEAELGIKVNYDLFDSSEIVEVEDGRVRLSCDAVGKELMAHSVKAPEIGSKQWLAARPEKIFINKQPPPSADRTVLKGTVLDLGYFGNLSIYRVQLSTGTVLQLSAQNRLRTAKRTVEWDDEVYVSWDDASAVLLDE